MAKKGVKLQPSDYVHLHNHTQYSLLDGLTKIPGLINTVKDMGMEAVAITDHGTMSGVIDFYKVAKSAQIKPVVGMEAYIAPRSHEDKDVTKDRQYFHLTMLAMNEVGYQNLMRLSTIANLDGFYYRPRIDHELLKKYNEGLIVLSGCIGGEVSDALRNDDKKKAKSTAAWYKSVFGDRYYVELQDHGHPDHPTSWAEQRKVNEGLLELAEELDVPALVTCDAHYLKHQDQEAHEILLCVQTGAFLSDESRFSLKEFDLHVIDPNEIIERWGGSHPELITNTKRVANRCQLKIRLDEILIPKFPMPKGETEKSLLEKLVWQGLAWRYGGKSRSASAELSSAQARKLLTKEVISRAEYELSVVDDMGFNGYYLIVADFINWGKDRTIVFGPGRGSAASSILAYGLRITEIDPLKYDLLFERFLNPDRISMPDMDIDIQDTRRDEVINYCIEKYGKERVANIVTFGRMAARNSVRDVARVLEVPYAEADRLAKMLPPPIQGRHTPLSESLQNVPELRAENQSNEQSARVFDLATRLEGTIRSHGVHAAGVVIAPDDIVNYTPLELAQKGVIATQYSMGPIEELGLLKMDFLGLSNLTTIKNALRIVKKVYGKDIEVGELPLDNKKTFDLLRAGETTGIFQLESAGMRRYLKQLQPTVFEDIIAMVALYRPGPMQWIDDFIARKHGNKSTEYLHPVMKDALENTYGVIVYQEQVMQISKDMCGFTGGQADTLRKAIGKKNPSVMAKLKSDFIEGAIRTVGADRKVMEKLWQQLEDFAAYCFNKVHSACYALIAYQTAYLKANYPAAFMAALMTSDYDDIDRLAIEISECQHMGIEVLPPDVNESFLEFGVVAGKSQIRFGLEAIKNVGAGAASEILRGRKAADGRFKTLEDFCKYVNVGLVNKKALDSLIRAGAFDSLGDRSVIYNSLENILALANRLQRDTASGQVDLFGDSSSVSHAALRLALNKNGPVYTQSEQLSWERELMGLYLSQNPLEPYAEILGIQTAPINSISLAMEGKPVTVGGAIRDIREITTKNGAKMAFVKIEDLTGGVELVLFPRTYQEVQALCVRDDVVIVNGKVGGGRGQSSDSEPKILVDQLQKLQTGKASIPIEQKLYIRVEDSSDEDLLQSLKLKLDNHHGGTEVVLVTGPKDKKQVIKLPQSVDINEQSLRELAGLFGSTNVVVK